MTIRQKLLKTFYPLWMRFSEAIGRNNEIISGEKDPPVSFYSLSTKLINGQTLDFRIFKGRKVLLVNTASDCGYTGQYRELQELFEQAGIAIIGFPANDFKGQEPGKNEEIAQFCEVKYGVSFPLAEKTSVKKGPAQHPVYRWLTDPALNGWNKKSPGWNFSKYLVNEKGVLVNYFGAAISPKSSEVTKAIQK